MTREPSGSDLFDVGRLAARWNRVVDEPAPGRHPKVTGLPPATDVAALSLEILNRAERWCRLNLADREFHDQTLEPLLGSLRGIVTARAEAWSRTYCPEPDLTERPRPLERLGEAEDEAVGPKALRGAPATGAGESGEAPASDEGEAEWADADRFAEDLEEDPVELFQKVMRDLEGLLEVHLDPAMVRRIREER